MQRNQARTGIITFTEITDSHRTPYPPTGTSDRLWEAADYGHTRSQFKSHLKNEPYLGLAVADLTRQATPKTTGCCRLLGKGEP